MTTPRWFHDCERCVFLGRHDDQGVSYDLYHCIQPIAGPIIIARYGSDGRDYLSGMEVGRIHAAQQTIAHVRAGGAEEMRPADPAHPLGEAYRRAQERVLPLVR